jgi:hypothetical protein
MTAAATECHRVSHDGLLLGAMRDRHSPALAGFVAELRDSFVSHDERAAMLDTPNATRAKI